MMTQPKFESRIKTSIKRLKNKIVNQTLIALSIMAIVAYVLTTIRATQYGFNWSFIIQSLMVAFLWSVTLLRKKFSIEFKIISLIGVIFFILTSGLYQFGFLAGAKMYIATVALFISFINTVKNSIISLTFFVLTYLIFGYLYTTGILTYSFDLTNYANNYLSWTQDATIILVTSVGLFYVGYSFQKTILDNNYKVERQNQKLVEYIGMNSHQVRSPLASILGLLQIHKLTNDETEKAEIMNSLHVSAESLDSVIKAMNRILEEEMLEDIK